MCKFKQNVDLRDYLVEPIHFIDAHHWVPSHMSLRGQRGGNQPGCDWLPWFLLCGGSRPIMLPCTNSFRSQSPGVFLVELHVLRALISAPNTLMSNVDIEAFNKSDE